MSEMVEVAIDSVRVSLMSAQRLVVLRDMNADRYLPIWVGPYEAEAITVALQEIEIARPLTHDLLKNVFTAFNAHIRRVEIVALRDDIFYGNIVVDADGQTINVDSRPSDAIALAVRAHVPILVDPSVMTQAGITPEQDIRSQAQTAASASEGSQLPSTPAAPATSPAPTKPATGEDTSRLSIFEDFLNKLDVKKPPSEDDKPDGPATS
ncbi:MAG: bifunctional nuclease family protein [Chthoniobacteraceae bacterium]